MRLPAQRRGVTRSCSNSCPISAIRRVAEALERPPGCESSWKPYRDRSRRPGRRARRRPDFYERRAHEIHGPQPAADRRQHRQRAHRPCRPSRLTESREVTQNMQRAAHRILVIAIAVLAVHCPARRRRRRERRDVLDRVRERQAGHAAEHVGHQRRRLRRHPGLRHRHQRQRRRSTVRFKVKTTAAAYRLDIYRMGYYGGNGARKVATRHAVGRAAADPADLLDRGRAPAWSTAATGPCRRRGPCRRPRCRASTSPSSSAPTARRREPHRLRRPRRREHTPTCSSRPPTRPGRPTTTTAATASTTGRAGRARLQGQLQPAVQHARRHDAERLRLQRRVPDGPLARSATATTSATSPASTPTARGAADPATTRRSCRSATTSTGRAASAPTSRRPATPASTSRSSAATRSSGRPAGSPASTAPAPPYRTLVTLQGDARQRQDRSRPGTWTGTWRDPRFSPPADGGRPENALTGTIFTVNGPTQRLDHGPGRGRQAALLAQHAASPTLAAGRDRRPSPAGTLGYEWDEDLDNGFRPPGLIRPVVDDVRRPPDKLAGLRHRRTAPAPRRTT